MNQDWERWGRDIRDIVQDAVDSQDFQKLNETISNTVNEAIFNLRENFRRRPGGPGPGMGPGPGTPPPQAGTITATARGTEPLQADPWDR